MIRVEHEVKHPSRRLRRALHKFGSLEPEAEKVKEGGLQKSQSQKMQSSRTLKRRGITRTCRQSTQLSKSKSSTSTSIGDVDLSESSESDTTDSEDEKRTQPAVKRKTKSARRT